MYKIHASQTPPRTLSMPFIHILLVQTAFTLAHVLTALRVPCAAYGMLSAGETRNWCKSITPINVFMLS